MKGKYREKSREQKEIARERINALFRQAKEVFKEKPELADRYVFLARKIAMRYKLRIPFELKRRFCKHCYKYLVSGRNCRIRVQRGKIVYYCLSCKRFMRVPYK